MGSLVDGLARHGCKGRFEEYFLGSMVKEQVQGAEAFAQADAKRSGEERLEEETDAAKEAIEKLQYTNKVRRFASDLKLM